MSRQAIIERERRWAPQVAALAVLPLVLYIAALVIESNAGIEVGGLLSEQFRSIEANAGALTLATVVRSLGLLAMAAPLLYLFRAVQARTERLQGALVGFTVLGPLLLAAQGIITLIAQRDVAAAFVEQAPNVGDVFNLAENLLEESTAQQIASGIFFAAVLALVFAMIYTPLWAVRTGLLTRFFGTFGMALGASLLLLPQIALLGILLWFAYLAAVIVGRTPGGRPAAWDAGEAVPWLKPGEEPVAAAGGGEVIEGDASEIPGLGDNPHSARRDRARKRKRKRRR